MALQAAADNLRKAGYAVIGLDLTWDETTKSKRPHFKPAWQSARPDNCEHFIHTGDNALAIVTGEASDCAVVDLDRRKPRDAENNLLDAVEVVGDLIQQHGLDPSIPTATTPSGGLHLFFSLSKSLAAGLSSAANGAKLAGMTLDIRGDRGCIICAPTQVNGVPYNWKTPIVPTADLAPLPPWLISLINQRNNSLSLPSTRPPPAKRLRPMSDTPTATVFQQRVETELQKVAPQHKMDKVWPRQGGIDFNFHDKTCSCPTCGNVHTSNNYRARFLISDVFTLSNYSTSCKQQAFGWELCSLVKQLVAAPAIDDTFCQLLLAAHRLQDRIVIFTSASRFISFNGIVWEDIHPQYVKQDIKALVQQLITPLICTIPKTEENEPKRRALNAARKFLGKAHNVSSVMQTFQTVAFDGDIEDHLDTNPDLLAVGNGVIFLPSGTLEAGKGHHKLSIQLETAYHDQLTPMIDAFFDSVFNGDQDTISYMQRLLGYGITGHTRQQVWAIWTGPGSNGKSLLMNLLVKLLSPFTVTMPAELLFDTGKNTAGSCTPHLQCLIKKRMGFKDEGKADKANVLNEELIKTVTGSSSIATRPLYKDYIEFKPSHLPILLCNKKPRINIHDAAMMRRVLVIPFPNVYTAPDSRDNPYNPANPTHRLRDDGLEERLSSIEGQEQLLTWLVKGAKEWYSNGLGGMPEAVGAAFDNYKGDNDHLSSFIDECCKEGSQINASAFRQALQSFSGISMKAKELREQMTAKGYKYLSNGGCFRGIELNDNWIQQ